MAEDAITCEFSQCKKLVKLDLGAVQPNSTTHRTLLVSGVRTDESEKFRIAPSCGCLSTTIGKRTNESQIELNVSLASGIKEGPSDQKIEIIREFDSEVVGTIVFSQQVRSKVRLARSQIDVTDLLGSEIELEIATPTEHEAEGIVVNAVSAHGAWLAEPSSRLGAVGKSVVLNIAKPTETAFNSAIHVVRFEWASNTGPGVSEVELVLNRKIPLHLLKNSLWLVKDSGSHSGKIWLKGSEGVADDVKEIEGLIRFAEKQQDTQVRFLRVGDSIWIGKVSIGEDVVTAIQGQQAAGHRVVVHLPNTKELVFDISISISPQSSEA
jgi:hypothetical protein